MSAVNFYFKAVIFLTDLLYVFDLSVGDDDELAELVELGLGVVVWVVDDDVLLGVVARLVLVVGDILDNPFSILEAVSDDEDDNDDYDEETISSPNFR